MNDAVRRKIIKFNPLKNVEKVSGERAKKKILTPEEAYRLLPRQWETVWPTYYAYVASKLAAYTGMRMTPSRRMAAFNTFLSASGP